MFLKYLWNVVTKIILKLNCGDAKPPVLAENLPFLENIFGLLINYPVFAKYSPGFWNSC